MPIYEYRCDECGSSSDELYPYPPPDTHRCDCGADSSRRFPAPARTPTKWSGYGLASVVKQSGPRTERPPNAMDTEALADGMSHRQWKAGRKKQRAEEIRKWCKENT